MDGEAQRLGRLAINDERKLVGPLDGQVAGFRALERTSSPIVSPRRQVAVMTGRRRDWSQRGQNFSHNGCVLESATVGGSGVYSAVRSSGR